MLQFPICVNTIRTLTAVNHRQAHTRTHYTLKPHSFFSHQSVPLARFGCKIPTIDLSLTLRGSSYISLAPSGLYFSICSVQLLTPFFESDQSSYILCSTQHLLKKNLFRISVHDS